MAFLHQIFESSIAQKFLDQIDLPQAISTNLKYEPRPYQIQAFKRYIYSENEEFPEKPDKPYHLLFNMATGSGKTLVMAGLILHLYQKGYRNFLFFVNSTNIIQKTKDNFLNSQASKYLFTDKIVIDQKQVQIKEVENFEEADSENINIKFTTIHKLHFDLNNTRENSVTYEDFEDKEIVLIADEAHHLSSSTKSNQKNIETLKPSWENTVARILKQNYENILLEFTATLDYNSQKIVQKYQGKVLYKYDLAEFRKDKYSKEISLLRSDYDAESRILQALLLNLYRQDLATSRHINLKPVILFKAKRYIKESKQNKTDFHQLIENLDPTYFERLRATSQIPIVQKAFTYFKENGISLPEITRRTQENFKPENCLSANESSAKNNPEGEASDRLLNTLEEPGNPIRAIFAVQKLNEGWDVLNLYDIVRLYEGRDGRSGKPGKTTLSEAQLIGRGARYFPFKIEASQELYKRKYDDDLSNDLRVLETMYYHTKEDSRYISELKKALEDTGIYEDEDKMEVKKLQLKLDFKNSSNYKEDRVFFNKKVPTNYSGIASFAALGVKKSNYRFTLSSGVGRESKAMGFELESTVSDDEVKVGRDQKITDIPRQIIEVALSKNQFFYFDRLKYYFPQLKSLKEFRESPEYLGGLEITFVGTKNRLNTINAMDVLQAATNLLKRIENEIKSNTTPFEGSPFIQKPLYEVFGDKEINVRKGDERENGQEDLVAHEPWYVYNANYGTKEEKKFIELFQRRFESLNQKFEDVYIVRNERTLAIYDRKGRRFEPDFLLFCKKKDKRKQTYQVFIEPKGKHLKGFDQWKEDFLLQIQSEEKEINIHTDSYLITAVPFYNYEDENRFQKELEKVLRV